MLRSSEMGEELCRFIEVSMLFYLVIETELAECRDVFGPFDHDHQLLLHRLTNVLHAGQLLLFHACRVHRHTHLLCIHLQTLSLPH